ncbi:MAG: hypothetical protein KVP17_001948 [Porospora cf. gigantea B]|nr:MAG: hypothetical protein KVP17_001948 [Porospora cf. gigantea B]
MCSGGVTVTTQLPFLSSTAYPLGSSFGGPVEGPEGEWKPSEVHVSDRLDIKGEQLMNDTRFLDILKQYDLTVQSLHIYLTSVAAGGKVRQPRAVDSSRRAYENYTSYKRPKEPSSPTSTKKRKLSESPSASTRDSPSPKNKESHSTRRRETASPSAKQVSPRRPEGVLCSLSKRGQEMCKVRAHFIRGSSRLQPPTTVDIAVRAPFDRLLSHLKRVSKEQLNKRGADPFGVWRITPEEGSEDGLDALTRYLQAKQRLGLVEGDPVVYLVPATPEVCKQLLLTDDSSLFAFCLLE